MPSFMCPKCGDVLTGSECAQGRCWHCQERFPPNPNQEQVSPVNLTEGRPSVGTTRPNNPDVGEPRLIERVANTLCREMEEDFREEYDPPDRTNKGNHLELTGYKCPNCSGKHFVREGRASLLDGECRWRCTACRKVLGTKRPTFLLLCYLLVCLIVTFAVWGGSFYLMMREIPADGRQLAGSTTKEEANSPPQSSSFFDKWGEVKDKKPVIVLVIVGAIFGPVGVLVTVRDLFRTRPQRDWQAYITMRAQQLQRVPPRRMLPLSTSGKYITMSNPITCPKCGIYHPMGARVCDCGQRLGEERQPQEEEKKAE